MLRFDYMPSDFNPLFLVLGDEHDLTRLVGVLRAFADQPKEISLGECFPAAVARASLTLVPEQGEDAAYGVRTAAEGRFRWGLNAWQAGQIADRLDALTPPENRSGSEILELGIEGEIPVKVSRGEFTDDFLIRTF